MRGGAVLDIDLRQLSLDGASATIDFAGLKTIRGRVGARLSLRC